MFFWRDWHRCKSLIFKTQYFLHKKNIFISDTLTFWRQQINSSFKVIGQSNVVCSCDIIWLREETVIDLHWTDIRWQNKTCQCITRKPFLMFSKSYVFNISMFDSFLLIFRSFFDILNLYVQKIYNKLQYHIFTHIENG